MAQINTSTTLSKIEIAFGNSDGGLPTDEHRGTQIIAFGKNNEDR